MNIDVFNEATELYNKYKLCEEIIEYLSNEDAVKGQKYKETLAKFADTFKGEFMMFVHEQMTACGEAFENLHDCNCNKPEDPVLPSEPKVPKFPIGSKVEVISVFGRNEIGIVKEYNSEDDRYYVVSNAFSMWFAESNLKPYIEEVENPEEPNESEVPSKPKFNIGDKVVITVPEYNGATATIADYNEADGYLLVDIEGYPEEEKIWFPEEVLALYVAPENPDENGGTTETDAGEQ